MRNRAFQRLLRSGLVMAATLATAAVPALAQQYVGISTGQFNYFAAAQQQNEWCWAASVQMILNYYGIPASQQEIVTRTYGVPVDAPGSDAAISSALNGLGRTVGGQVHTIRSSSGPGLPPPAVLIDELNQQHPILIAFMSGPNSGHAVVVTAASFVSTPMGPQVVSLVVRDPWPTPYTIATEGRVEIAGPSLAQFAQTVRGYWLVRVE
ncbi:MAG: C39 family peptidase [Silvibacterium sp.]|nr:C39 family peptidase [Silvibacterium sp.]